MRGWLVYSEERLQRNQEYVRMHEQWCASQGIGLTLVLAEQVTYGMGPAGVRFCVANKPVAIPNFCVFRCEEADLRRALELCGVVVSNGSYVGRVANDKLRTYELVHALGVPYPEVLSVGMPAWRELEYPVVAKPRYGHGGEGVRLILNPDELEEYARRGSEGARSASLPRCADDGMAQSDRSWIVQRVAPVVGKDVRVYMLGKEVLAAMLRTAPEGAFLSNFCRGGSAAVYELSAQERDVALRIAQALGDGYYGIDFLFDGDGGLLLNEVEDVVGSRMLYEHTALDVVGRHLSYVTERCRMRGDVRSHGHVDGGGDCHAREHG